MRGLRPMSPKTSICTLGLPFCVAGSYCEGSSKISTVSALERQNTMLIRDSIMTIVQSSYLELCHKVVPSSKEVKSKESRYRISDNITWSFPPQGPRQLLLSSYLEPRKVLEAHPLAVRTFSNAGCFHVACTLCLSFKGSVHPWHRAHSYNYSPRESPIQQRNSSEQTMSTGAPPQIANLAPPFNGHDCTHSHSRSRGHSRTTRWAQPPPLALGSSNGNPSQLEESPDTVNASYSYTHKSQPSWSHHNHSASSSHSISHHTHNHSHSVASVHDEAHVHDVKAQPSIYTEHSSEQMYVDGV